MQAHWLVRTNSAPLLHQHRNALTDFLERDFETTKFLRAQLREHLPHLPGMLSEGWSNEIPAARGERNDTNPAVFAALYAADEPLREKAVHGDTDRTWGQIDDRAYRIDGQRPFVKQDFQHAEIREAEPSLFNTGGCVPPQGA